MSHWGISCDFLFRIPTKYLPQCKNILQTRDFIFSLDLSMRVNGISCDGLWFMCVTAIFTHLLNIELILETYFSLCDTYCPCYRVCRAKQTAPCDKEHSQTGPGDRGAASWPGSPGGWQGYSERPARERPDAERSGHGEWRQQLLGKHSCHDVFALSGATHSARLIL